MLENTISLDLQKLPNKKSILRRIGKHPHLMHYNRLIFLVAIINLVFLALNVSNGTWWTKEGIDLIKISNFVIVNFSIAIIIRQHYVINFLFWIATRAPTSWPLRIRWTLGKVYHFGGFHVGCAIAATIWFAVFAASLTYHSVNGLPGASVGIMTVTYALLFLLLLIIVMSLPSIRARFHDNFEMTHRFGGWTSLVLFWTQTLLFINDQKGESSFGSALVTSLGFWMLIALTISIALPWLRLRKVAIKIEKPSSHVALVQFDHGVTPFEGSSTAISRNPLVEWHSFANVPTPGESGFRLTISRAGDWTGDFLDDLPSHVWVKGIPTAGVGNIELLFKRVIWVATGSGIGPCIPHLLTQKVPSLLVWSTRSPRKTYGDKLVDEIMEVQPNAMIWNTDEDGKPDILKLAYQAYQSFNAEAVICISNKKLTWQVVYGMESRGIPAYGAIWDS